MAQNHSKELVVDILLKGEDHPRSIAKKMNTYHSNIGRIIQNLLADNIVDYKEVGRSKVYFLKKTLEAKTAVFSMEQHKLFLLLQKHSKLRKLIEELQNLKEVPLVVLFGSYAKGTETKNSDVDVYVMSTNLEIKKVLEKKHSKLSVKLGKYKDSPLIKEIEQHHIIIKGVEVFYDYNKFFT